MSDAHSPGWCSGGIESLRGGDDDFSINKFLVEGGALTVLVRGGHQGVTLLLEPLAETKLIFGGSEQKGLLLGVDTAL